MGKGFRIVLFSTLLVFQIVSGQEFTINTKKIERQARKLIKRKKVPGLSISVIRNDSLMFSKGYGYADLENKVLINSRETLFRIASISKSLSAYGLAKAVEQNYINLDTTAFAYLPNFPQKKYDFTIRDLGGHLSGIRSYKGNEFKNSENLSIREGLEFFKSDSLLFEPRTDYAYTSYGWNLISMAIENAVKTSFEDFMKKNVLNPLSLKQTIADKNEYIEGKAIFYSKPKLRRKFHEVEEVHNYFKLAGGGYLSTSEDIANFGKALLNYRKIDATIFNEFITSQTLNDNSKTYYGIGFQTSFDHKNRPYFGHFGSGLGGYGLFYVYPRQKTVIVILMNCSDPKQQKRFNKIIDAVVDK
ncbi:MAG: beta-lactamase family protein [Winogradskyella sp.]|uniref:serine hydrolase domain-containing protein n=1 Tax=Winogradskyella sp. TaxID=1883156 RepID=UPI0025E69FC8|nr:serine hydrolase domain-containing protein [Winogradskyella sp.]NRB61361.1 beta-lactamase family protein [Winogradskyella sp.]